ncbi:hypothetical protein D3H65_12510 [Paraflavitalea soli]|uniref:Thioredoxin domain-containing protein n=1 Tax=Paraflavitalea soli TaxID=2315862 RepID=A0A3B7MJX3_9BACT|nr:redoxin domain-containing protein [Paraflavitalea soli]AXY74754.1 hypothetical protein D3H65_12510 [Paraflavitalea soli]
MKYTFIILILLIASCQSEDKQLDTTVPAGMDIPAFNAQLADSTTWITAKDIPQGQATALVYFGPYCPYSKHQVKEILDNVEDLKNIRVYLITPFPYQAMHQFYDFHKLSQYKNIITASDTANTIGTSLNIVGFPYTAIYNSNGKLVKAYYGSIKIQKIKDALKTHS